MERGAIVAKPELGGLHHQYERLVALRLARFPRRPQSYLKLSTWQFRQETEEQIVLLTDFLGKLVKLSE